LAASDAKPMAYSMHCAAAARKMLTTKSLQDLPVELPWERLETASSPPSRRGQAVWMATAPTKRAAELELL
jgi:hypothetical protein